MVAVVVGCDEPNAVGAVNSSTGAAICPVDPESAEKCTEEEAMAIGLLIAGFCMASVGIILANLADLSSERSRGPVKFMAVLFLTVPGLALIIAWLGTGAACATPGYVCQDVENLCGGYYCAASAAHNCTSATSKHVSPAVVSGLTLAPLGLFMLILTRTLYSLQQKHQKVFNHAWKYVSLLLLFVGSAMLAANEAGLLAECPMSSFHANNPSGRIGVVAMFVSCGVIGLIVSVAASAVACGYVRKSCISTSVLPNCKLWSPSD